MNSKVIGVRHFVLIVVIALVAACRRLITVPAPVTQLSSESVFADNATAAGVLTGIYTTLSSGNPIPTGESFNYTSLLCGLSADELTLYGGQSNTNSILAHYYQNALTPGSTGQSGTILSNCYTQIYVTNITLARLSISVNLTPSVKIQLTGEAKFLRAFFYFYLVNLYGAVPLTTSIDYATNNILAKSSPANVYRQVIDDLKDAQSKLSDNYVGPDAMSSTLERVRPNKWAAAALLARAYLYTGAYDSAESEASALIGNSGTYTLDSLNSVFLRNSTEAIWQLQPVNAGWNTNDARVFILPLTGPTTNGSTFPVYLSSDLLNNFENHDLRRVNWVDSVIVSGYSYFFPYKYKSAAINAPLTEYEMVLRLAEQFLIRAEARAQKSNISGAQFDLNIIRKRAGLPNTTANTQSTLLAAITHERQIELFTEWGHRWLDLKRIGQVDAVLGMPGNVCAEKGGTWNSDWQWFPIPAYDIFQDPNLTQNAGY